MKIFKKLIAVLAAVIMAVSLFAFAGCNETTKSKFMKLAEQDFAALECNIDCNIINNYEKSKYDINLKANSDGYADIVINDEYTYKNYDEEITEKNYVYFFMRGWKAYDFNDNHYYGHPEPIYEITNPEDLYGVFDLNEIIDTFKIKLSDAVNMLNSFILNFAENFNAISDSEGKLTADLNKAFCNAVKELKPVVDDLKDETTVGDILKNNVIKKIVSPITNIIKPTTIINAVKQALTYLDNESKVVVEKVLELFNSVKPDKNSTTYDYIVKLVNSQKTVDFINGMIGNGVGITKKLSDFTLKEIFGMIGLDISIDDVKQMVDELLSKVKITDNSIESDDIYLKNVKVEYIYKDDYKLITQSFTGVYGGYSYEVYDIEGKIEFKDKKIPDSDFIKLPDKLPEIEYGY